MTKISPDHTADISKAFAEYAALNNAQPLHPTQTAKGSVWVNHADGSYSHWQVRRPMSMQEVTRKERLEFVQKGRQVQAGFMRRIARASGFLK